MIGAAPAARGDSEVRVLLRETRGAVRVGRAGGPTTAIAPVAAGLHAGGRPAGPVWRLRGELIQVDDLRVRGEVAVHRTDAGIAVVNRVPLEPYVAGTLGRELYAHWAAETLKAQAVASRTYALHRARAARRGRRPWDLDGDTSGQVYGGVTAETAATRAAAAATRGEWLAWHGEPILAVFHSASGGRTAAAEEVWGRALPYLPSHPVDDEDLSPDTYWRAAFPRTTLGPALAPLGVRVGPIRELRVVQRSPSGRALVVRVLGRDGGAEVEGRALREILGATVIRSTLFEIRESGAEVVFVGSGYGHGVGMSQWGAEAMARAGASYRTILARFYPGAEIRNGVPK